MDGTDYLARIDFFDYPFAPFTNESDPAILRIWAELRPYLYTRGYVIPEQIKSPWLCGVLYLAPDDHPIPKDGSNAIRARRKRDSAPVIVKIIMQPSRELAIHRHLLDPQLRDHPHNHTVPIIDVFPYLRWNGERYLDWMLVIEPTLHAQYVQHSLIDVRGQVFVAVRQLLEGLAFMHSHNIAHGDICAQNIFYMSGTEFRDGVPAHSAPPSYFPRAWRPPRYFYLDFGFAVKLNPTSGRRTVYNGGYIEMPEVQGWETASEPLFYDPFAADVYCLAHTIKATTMMLLDWHEDPRLVAYPNGFIALLESMLHGDPAERPSADECLRRFNAEMQDVPRYKLLLPDAPLHDLPVIFRVDWKEATSYVCNALACLVFGMHGRVM